MALPISNGMDTFNKLTELFSRFPGIGPRQAKRFVYFLLSTQPGYREELVRLLLDLKNVIAICDDCRRFFTANGKRNLCPICVDSNRDHNALMVVEKDVDLENIERAKVWQGTYFVLGGSVPILEKKPEERIRLHEFQKLIDARSKKGLEEIVLALSLTTEGENTTHYLLELLSPLVKKNGFKVSTLGRGLSTGLELEYSDSETIRNALKNRQ